MKRKYIIVGLKSLSKGARGEPCALLVRQRSSRAFVHYAGYNFSGSLLMTGEDAASPSLSRGNALSLRTALTKWGISAEFLPRALFALGATVTLAPPQQQQPRPDGSRASYLSHAREENRKEPSTTPTTPTAAELSLEEPLDGALCCDGALAHQICADLEGTWNLQADAAVHCFMDFSDFFVLPGSPLRHWRMSAAACRHALALERPQVALENKT